MRNGTEPFPHMYSSWMSIDKNHSRGTWITVIWQAYATAYGGFFVAAYDSTAIVIMRLFGGKLDVLRERAKLMLGASGNVISNDEAGKKNAVLTQRACRAYKVSKRLFKIITYVST